MGGYVARRLLLVVPTLLGLSILIFGLGAAAGSPVDLLAARSGAEAQATGEQINAINAELGLDQPLPVRYARWLGKAVTGDFGRSLFSERSVSDQIGKAFPKTVLLSASALVLIVVLAIPMGVAGALFHRKWEDQILRFAVLFGASIPAFLLAYVLVDLFAVRLQWLPVAGLDGASSLVLPAFTLALGPATMVSRLLRSSLIDTLGEDYIRTARGKGLGAVPVMFDHAVRNAALPVITVLGSVFGRMLEGAVIVEVIFNWSGIGNLTLNALLTYDYPVVMGVVLFAGAVFMVLNLLVDLSYGLVDPRARVEAA